MKAEDTVMSINNWLDNLGIDRAYKKDMKPTYEHIKPSLEWQAKVTFKAGIKGVIGFMDKLCPHTGGLEEQQLRAVDCPECWQAQLKEWGYND